jgi:hypothetical protein
MRHANASSKVPMNSFKPMCMEDKEGKCPEMNKEKVKEKTCTSKWI